MVHARTTTRGRGGGENGGARLAALVTDYFAAPTDALAATIVHQSAGPSTSARGSGEPLFDTVRLPSVEPFVMLGRLAEQLLGLPYAEVTSHPRHGALLAGDDHGPWVVTVSEDLVTALAATSPARLAEIARHWSRGRARGAHEPEALAAAVPALGALADRARSVRHTVYCWAAFPDAGVSPSRPG